MQSDLESTCAACYKIKDYQLQISRRVAQVLFLSGRITETQLRFHSTRDWPSMYDNRVHVPFHGIFKHTQKAVVTIFTDTSTGVTQAIHSDTWTKGAFHAAEGLIFGLGKGVGHLCVGCLSLYGEVTDVLDAAPSFYDPYG